MVKLLDGTEIKPCPFCGSDRIEEENNGDGVHSYFWYICRSCNAETDGSKDITEARNMWNRRSSR
jgi:Lar family restriction alleviation protein